MEEKEEGGVPVTQILRPAKGLRRYSASGSRLPAFHESNIHLEVITGMPRSMLA